MEEDNEYRELLHCFDSVHYIGMFYNTWDREWAEGKTLIQAFEVKSKDPKSNCLLILDGVYINKYIGSIDEKTFNNSKNLLASFSGHSIPSLSHKLINTETALEVLLDDCTLYSEDVIPDKIIKLFIKNNRAYSNNQSLIFAPVLECPKRSRREGLKALKKARVDDNLPEGYTKQHKKIQLKTV